MGQQGGSAATISTQMNNIWGDREFPIFGYNGLYLNTIATATRTRTSSFTLFEPRYLIMANECWGRGRENNNNNGSNEKLLLCVSTALPRPGQVAVLARMEACTDVTTTTTTRPQKRMSLIRIRRNVILRSVREDLEKEGLWYAQITTTASTTTESSSRRNNNCNCIIS